MPPYDDISDLILADRYPGTDRNANYWAIQRAISGGAPPPDRVVSDAAPYSGPGPLSGVYSGSPSYGAYQPNPYPHGPTVPEPRVDPRGNYVDRPENPIITDRPPTGRPPYMQYREDEEFTGRGPGSGSALQPSSYQGAQIAPQRTYGFRGAMGGGGAIGDEEYPMRQPVPQLPYAPYAGLEASDPAKFTAITQVAKDMRISPVTLTQLMHASSEGDPQAENGGKVGWMGLTRDDARTYDPEGHLDINDPIHNLYLGAVKYSQLAKRFGMNTPESFAAYYAGPEAVETAMGRHGDDHARVTPPGTFNFVNKVVGRDQESRVKIEPLSSSAARAELVPMQPGSGGQPGREALRRTLGPERGPPEEMWTPDQEPIQPRSETMQTPDQEPQLRRIPDDPLSPPTLPYNPGSGDYGGGGAPARRRAAPARSADVSADELNRQERMRLTATGVTEPGNIDLGLRPRVRNPDGSVSTVRSMSFNENGRQVLVPTVAEDGSRILSEQEAIDQYRRTGRHLGKFDTPQNATAYSQDLHRSQERTYANRMEPGPGTQQVAMAPTGYPVTQTAALAPPGSQPARPPDPYSASLAAGARTQPPPDQLDKTAPPGVMRAGPGPAVTPTGRERLGTGGAMPGGEVAVGDSIAAHLVRKAGVGGQEDRTKVGSYRPGDTAVSGWGPQQILDQVIPGIPEEQIRGRTVFLSTGASNNPGQLEVIQKQIQALRDKGAANVVVLGVGTDPKLAGVNDKLAQIAKDNQVAFAGPMGKVASDRIHSADPQDLLRQARAAAGGDRVRVEPLASQAAPAGATTGSGQQAALPPPGPPMLGGGETSAAATAAARAMTAPGGPDSPAGRARGMVPVGPVDPNQPVGVGVGGVQLPPAAIDRFTSNPGTMTPQGLVRAAGSGPDSVLTYISRGAGRGLSTTDAWNQALDKLTRAAMLQDGPRGAMQAFAYVTLMQHRGVMQNLMQAHSMLRDDPQGAAQFLAKAHAFAPDGSEIHFRVADGQVYGARFNEQTHEQIGQPFLVTEQGVRRQIQAFSDPTKLAETVHSEYTANLQEQMNNEHMRHNRVSEVQQAETHRQTHLDREEARKLREQQAELQREQHRADKEQQDRQFQQEQKRQEYQFKESQERYKAESEKLHHERELERQRRETQDKQHAADKAATEQRIKEENDRRADERARVAEQASRQHRRDVDQEAQQMGWDRGRQVDDNKKPFKGAAAVQASTYYTGIRMHNEDIPREQAMDLTRGLMSGRFGVKPFAPAKTPSNPEPPHEFHVVDRDGNTIAVVPQKGWRAYHTPTQ